MDYPETPEGVALFLLMLALAQNRIKVSGSPAPTAPDIFALYADLASSRMSPAQILELYRECLKVTTTRWQEQPGPVH